MARKLAKEEGIFCGYSAGSCLQGLMQLRQSLKKEDLVVCVFHDHGSRYVGKIYNDQWMIERGFLDVKTFKDIISTRGTKKLITVSPDQTVSEAFEAMQKYNVENRTVTRDGEVIGAISESGLSTKIMIEGLDIKNRKVTEVLEPAYPVISFDTTLERISALINKENGAVLGKDDTGVFHIVTKYDVIQALSN